jgi:hypothetical protein
MLFEPRDVLEHRPREHQPSSIAMADCHRLSVSDPQEPGLGGRELGSLRAVAID